MWQVFILVKDANSCSRRHAMDFFAPSPKRFGIDLLSGVVVSHRADATRLRFISAYPKVAEMKRVTNQEMER